MSPGRLLLCTDMDRTVIPNGQQSEHPAARKAFRGLCRQSEVQLVYVTGRHRQLVQEALIEYDLPIPDFAITDVGSRIYRVQGSHWQELESWQEQIARDWKGHDHGQLELALRCVDALILQEPEKQNRYKLSYYLPLEADQDKVLAQMRQRLQALGVDASLIWSIDEPAQIGLLDVLPESATKLHAIQFLQQQLSFTDEETLFAGDSGNDLPVLGSQIPSVLVANASDAVRTEARQLAAANGHTDALYLASGHGFPLGGNYAAGILQGVVHFYPAFGHNLPLSETES
jgi:sucrose-6F-phosphate phosphohydrolase